MLIRSHARARAILLFLGVCVSCSGGASGSGGSAAGSGAESGTRAVPLPPPRCPAEEPGELDSCTEQGLLCSYGSSTRVDCRPTYECDGTVWRTGGDVRPPSACTPALEGQCPDQMPEDGSGCPVRSGVPCEYGSNVCYCPVRCGPGYACRFGTDRWQCFGPSPDLNCPELAPNLGAGCAQQGIECFYGDRCDSTTGRRFFCRDGAWEYVSGGSCGG